MQLIRAVADFYISNGGQTNPIRISHGPNGFVSNQNPLNLQDAYRIVIYGGSDTEDRLVLDIKPGETEVQRLNAGGFDFTAWILAVPHYRTQWKMIVAIRDGQPFRFERFRFEASGGDVGTNGPTARSRATDQPCARSPRLFRNPGAREEGSGCRPSATGRCSICGTPVALVSDLIAIKPTLPTALFRTHGLACFPGTATPAAVTSITWS